MIEAFEDEVRMGIGESREDRMPLHIPAALRQSLFPVRLQDLCRGAECRNPSVADEHRLVEGLGWIGDATETWNMEQDGRKEGGDVGAWEKMWTDFMD